MEKIDNYLQIMIESLEKKSVILDRLISMNEEQSKCVSGKTFETIDWDTFNIIISQKEAEIDRINAMDESFQSLYDKISDQIKANYASYKEEIRRIQELIKEIEEKSIAIRAGEERNRAMIDNILLGRKKDIKQARTSLKAASNYYKSMQKPFQNNDSTLITKQ